MEGGRCDGLRSCTLHHNRGHASSFKLSIEKRTSARERAKNCDTDTVHKEKQSKRRTIERSSLSHVYVDRGISPGIVSFLDLDPRRILPLYERLAALRTVPRNLH